ncbi:FUSC family protein [Lysobacter sp. GX 14042]|uniref:FUSC family protein n=1 Tax=Lysobacter sp. GX 14042 TaxID=2907155 RepID=UPI001F2C52FD|nr:FUSC family protein [Lysobacter sp. GX 14042]MCE7032027.1 FUSC family protein [Lysobacter sp. GX 14042]
MPVPGPDAPESLPSPAWTARGMLRSMCGLRPQARSRFVFSSRAALCLGMPVLAGWLAGDLQAGMMAATGGFTGLYGRGRPYPSRAMELAIIALAFALSVAVGIAVSATHWAVVPTVALIAMVATWLGNALKIGPPGPYMFLLACAAAAAMPADHLDPARAFGLVLCGGAFAWLMQMSGVLVRPRGPEQRAVASAAARVAGYIEAIGSPLAGAERQLAAQALNEAWHALVRYQPARSVPGGALAGLRQRARGLNVLFAEAMEAAAGGTPLSGDAPARARRLGDLAVEPPAIEAAVARGEVPLGQPGALAALRESLRLRSMSTLVVGRVGLAALLAGAVGALLDLERAYWAVAAAVLMLHQGMEWFRLVQRSIERLAGTWAGLLLAAAVLWFQPQGLWLVALIMLLQFTVEMLVLRNYALAVIFITGAGMTLATGGLPVPDLGSYLLARGVDTAVGCAVALLVFRLAWPQASAALIPEQLSRTLAATDAVVEHLAAGDVTSPAAREARSELQHRGFALSKAYDTATAATRRPRMSAERMWPAIAATEQLAFRILGSCWAIERLDREAARARAGSMFGEGGLQALRTALEQAAAAADGGPAPQATARLPGFVEAEVADLCRSLRG